MSEIKDLIKSPIDYSKHIKKYKKFVLLKNNEREEKIKEKLKELAEKEKEIKLAPIIEMDYAEKERKQEKIRKNREIKERMSEYYESIKETVKESLR